MAIGLRFLKLVAKIALDKLIGSIRTDEAVKLLQDWWSGEDEASRDQELAGAKAAASDSRELEKVVAETVAATGGTVAQSQIEAITLSVSSGFSALPLDIGNDAGKTIADQVLPGRSKTFVVWLDHPAFAGPRRYVHFNWDDDAWRVRDFVGSKIFHPLGKKVVEKGLVATEVGMSALEVWKASRGQVQSLTEYGLGFPVTKQDDWQQILSLISRVADEWKTT